MIKDDSRIGMIVQKDLEIVDQQLGAEVCHWRVDLHQAQCQHIWNNNKQMVWIQICYEGS